MNSLDRLKLVEIDNEWYVMDGDQRHPIHLVVGTVGWSIPLTPYMTFDMTCYNKKYVVHTGMNGKGIVYIEHDGEAITELEISPGHPAAEFFKKVCAFDDGVKRVVPITQNKPTQPY